MGEQHNDLIAKRAVGQHMLQDGFPLPLVGNPGNRGGNRDEAPLLAPNAFANGIEGISPVTEPDTPAVEAAERTDAPSDRRWCEFGPRKPRHGWFTNPGSDDDRCVSEADGIVRKSSYVLSRSLS
jgi:hypothetical protein